jgi:hypothetical protein
LMRDLQRLKSSGGVVVEIVALPGLGHCNLHAVGSRFVSLRTFLRTRVGKLKKSGALAGATRYVLKVNN